MSYKYHNAPWCTEEWINSLKEEGLWEVDNQFNWIEEREKELRAQLGTTAKSLNKQQNLEKRPDGYYKSAKGLLTSLAVSIKATCKRKDIEAPSWSSDASKFKDWMISQDNFDFLYNRWMESGNLKVFKPNIQRIDTEKGFELDNLKLTTSGERKYETKSYKKGA